MGDSSASPPICELLLTCIRPLPIIGGPLAAAATVLVELHKIHLKRVKDDILLHEIVESAELLSASIVNGMSGEDRNPEPLLPLVERFRAVVDSIGQQAIRLQTRQNADPTCWTGFIAFWKAFVALFASPTADSELARLKKELDDSRIRFTTEANIVLLVNAGKIGELVEKILKLHQTTQFDNSLETLNPVHNAFHNSDGAPGACSEGTRQRILSDIVSWATSSTDSQVAFWLTGPAGAGKSAIARSVCERLEANRPSLGHTHLLNFFASPTHTAPASHRNSTRTGATQMVHTFAYYLARLFPELRGPLRDAIQENPGVLGRPIGEQVRILLQDSLGRLKADSGTLIIVLDAFDVLENGTNDRDRGELLRALLELPRSTPMRVRLLVAGRSTPASCGIFAPLSAVAQPSTRILKLQDAPSFETRHDILVYLREKLSTLNQRRPTGDSEWQPSDRDIEELATRSGSLFRYAAAVVHNLERAGRGSLQQRLTSLLRDGTSAPICEVLDEMYRDILVRIFGASEKSEVKEHARDLLAALILLKRCLTVKELAKLVDDDYTAVQNTLDLFHAVVVFNGENSIPTIFHRSFAEFLQDNTRCPDPLLRIDFGRHHAIMAYHCLRVVCSTIWTNETVIAVTRFAQLAADLRRSKQTGVDDVHSYSFRFWSHHLHLADASHMKAELGDVLKKFSTDHVQPWVGIMRELEEQSWVSEVLTKAVDWCKAHADDPNVAKNLERSINATSRNHRSSDEQRTSYPLSSDMNVTPAYPPPFGESGPPDAPESFAGPPDTAPAPPVMPPSKALLARPPSSQPQAELPSPPAPPLEATRRTLLTDNKTLSPPVFTKDDNCSARFVPLPDDSDSSANDDSVEDVSSRGSTGDGSIGFPSVAGAPAAITNIQ